ncbi:nitroreductase family deazaflavin-dependent oxidoreductase [Mangrovimicrobium sediminis]|uniref:Nitroreductase family deazaflavin-dependent oxidoreductase n=1 Tax=Mangrovimicrobium sediminis TaxID=2562682 RepID=A0A4Z0LW20_9GAMM|nr:nitroreductase family deazaflavin-dependent oxidoreductase [Haliea sp. SAOS-164]TGD71275.1 nitroreductase family deazaflavin-dependent oxidoreductase [Haliea sp. SAOS-164]
MSDDSRYIKTDISLLNQEHVARYRETNGEVGHIWNGATALLLTSIGNKSGEPRTTPLIYASDGDDYIVVASMGGAPRHPAWYLNVERNPQVEIQVLDKVMPATATTVEGPERERLWQVVTAQWPNYDQYQERTERRIPVVKLTPNT